MDTWELRWCAKETRKREIEIEIEIEIEMYSEKSENDTLFVRQNLNVRMTYFVGSECIKEEL